MNGTMGAARRRRAPTLMGILAEMAFVATLGGACCIVCLLAFLAAR